MDTLGPYISILIIKMSSLSRCRDYQGVLYQGVLIIKMSRCPDYQGVLIIKVSSLSKCRDYQDVEIIKVA